MDVDVSKIWKGDRVKVRLYGLPESDWLEVAMARPVVVKAPDGTEVRVWYEHDITAHGPAAPALPDWWGSKVILDEGGYGVFIGGGYVFPLDSTHVYGPDEVEDRAVLVIVDRDGNLPTARVHPDAYAREQRWREQAVNERDEARADLVAFRAEVAKRRRAQPVPPPDRAAPDRDPRRGRPVTALIRKPVQRHPLRLHRWRDVDGMAGFMGLIRQCSRCYLVEVYLPITDNRHRGDHTMLIDKGADA